jgi:uncharacterized membrane protein
LVWDGEKMLYLVLGLLIFFGVHSVRMVAPGFRIQQMEMLGEGAWKGIYAAASAGGLALIVYGWMLFRFDSPYLYVPVSWARHVTALAVLVGFVFVAAAYSPSGRIKSMLKHPMMIGILIWAGGHLLANGDLASVLLFSAFAFYALVYLIAVRLRGEQGPEFKGYSGDVIAVMAGAAAFVVFAFYLHGWLFGVSPF